MLMPDFYLFPFNRIDSGKKIIIYGAGTVGRGFLHQIRITNYCKLVAVADKKASQYGSDKYALIFPNEISQQEYDFLIIAIKDKGISLSIVNDLIELYGIPKRKILWDYDRVKISQSWDIDIYYRPPLGAACYRGGVSIALMLFGGLGDNIITKKIMYLLLSHLKNGKCYVDLYVPPSKEIYAQTIFSDVKFICNIFAKTISPNELKCYDIVFRFDYVLKFYHINLDHIRTLDPEFSNFLCKFNSWIAIDGLDADRPLERNILFARAKIKKRNCYTYYSDFLCTNDIHIGIPLQEEYWLIYRELDLGKYITINFGWGENLRGKTKFPNKVWPIRHYEKFVKLFHQCFPNFSVVQLGTDDGIHIKGVDRYIFGQSLELVKYVLRDSFLHIDCEGGLVHLATQLGTKCCVLFGPTPVHYFGYKENINIVAEACQNCCYLYDDFSICARGMDEPECMASIRPEIVMEQVAEYLYGILCAKERSVKT